MLLSLAEPNNDSLRGGLLTFWKIAVKNEANVKVIKAYLSV